MKKLIELLRFLKNWINHLNVSPRAQKIGTKIPLSTPNVALFCLKNNLCEL